MKSILKMIFLVGALQATVANADFTGNDFRTWDKMYKLMYIAGVTDAGYNWFFCAPPTVTNGQYLAIVEKFMNSNPELWDKLIIHISQYAIDNAYPCTKERKPATKSKF